MYFFICSPKRVVDDDCEAAGQRIQEHLALKVNERKNTAMATSECNTTSLRPCYPPFNQQTWTHPKNPCELHCSLNRAQCVVTDGWWVMNIVTYAADFLLCLSLSPLRASSVSLAGDHNGSGEYHAITVSCNCVVLEILLEKRGDIKKFQGNSIILKSCFLPQSDI